MGDCVSAEAGYEQLMERNVLNCSIASNCPTAPCAEAQTSMFALLFRLFLEQGKREVAFPPSFSSGADNANYPLCKEGGLQPHMVLETLEPEAAGAVKGPEWPRLSRRASTTRTHTTCESTALGRVVENWALIPPLQARGCQRQLQGPWDGGLCEQSACREQEIIISLEATGLVS